MAVTETDSAQLAPTFRGDPRDKHGKFRIAYFSCTQVGVGDTGSEFNLCKLPPGNVRVLPHLSRYSLSALGSARTLDIGFRAHQTQGDGTLEAEDPDALVANVDAENAISAAAISTAIKFDLYSVKGVTVMAQVNDAGIPDGATLEGFIAYVCE